MPAVLLPHAVPAEPEVLRVWPSVVATRVGRWMGLLLTAVPVRVGPAAASVWLFAVPLAPLAAGIYLWQKVFGVRYRLTTGRLVAETALGGKELDSADLREVATAAVRHRRHDRFFRTGDLILRDAAGHRRLTAYGIPHVENLRRSVLETRDAAASVAEAHAVIAARGGVGQAVPDATMVRG